MTADVADGLVSSMRVVFRDSQEVTFAGEDFQTTPEGLLIFRDAAGGTVGAAVLGTVLYVDISRP